MNTPTVTPEAVRAVMPADVAERIVAAMQKWRPTTTLRELLRIEFALWYGVTPAERIALAYALLPASVGTQWEHALAALALTLNGGRVAMPCPQLAAWYERTTDAVVELGAIWDLHSAPTLARYIEAGDNDRAKRGAVVCNLADLAGVPTMLQRDLMLVCMGEIP